MTKKMFSLFLVLFLLFSLSLDSNAQDFKSSNGTVIQLNDAPLNFRVTASKMVVNPTTGVEFPVFEMAWDNPDSISDLENALGDDANHLFVAVDYRIIKDNPSAEWESAIWEEKADFSALHTRPSQKKLVFQVENIVPESDGKYLATDFEFRICYSYLYGDPLYISSPYSSPLVKKSYVGASAWAVDFLNQAASLDIIPSRLMDKKMSDPITREEFAEMAVKFYEMVTGNKAIPSNKTFLDCSNPEVLKAFQLDITAGVGDGTKFEPHSLLMRQQMATMITKTLTACYPNIVFDLSDQPDFKDQKDFATYAIDRAKFMAKYQITVGDGKGSFAPRENCTREQAIIFLVKSYQYRNQYKYK